MNNCPNCGEKFRTFVKLNDDDTYRTWVESRNGRESLLRSSLLGYWRWIAEGKSQFGPSCSGEQAQYFYDPYHNHIAFNSNTRQYEFSIQVSDSPDGDVWWNGSFTVVRAMEFKEIQGKETA